ncbi:alpha/beta hydrolase [Acidaminococcus massiliensis]|uniref:alpha/beta hydrolase n=1 Tax=Acidaminococcus massiliensis TaxID=1852375 RepID=UPI0009F3DBD8|nr:alpha/beta hydrolase [Acidaminococcus massiliensis]
MVTEFFYIGGVYLEQDNKHMRCHQVYVEHYLPQKQTHPYPVVFFSGTGMTGTNWMTKPDGEPGWADYFLSKGYEIYLVDQPARGRSSYNPILDGKYTNLSVETVESLFTHFKETGTWPQAHLHSQWPGKGVSGDKIFDKFMDSTVAYLLDNDKTQKLAQRAGAALLDKIGPAILLTHSQAGAFGWLIADVRPPLVKGIIAIEPLGPPRQLSILTGKRKCRWGITDIPITFSPEVDDSEKLLWVKVKSLNPNYIDSYLQEEPARQLLNLKGIPILIVSGEASYHAPCDIWISRFLTQAGIKNEYIELANYGIHGNGHLMMLEKNSDEIASLIIDWLKNIKL